MTNSETFQMDSPESWEIARGYAGLFGAIPTSFTTALRFLVADQEKNSGQVGQTARYHALRLIKGKSLKAPFYYAILTFKPNHFKDAAKISEDDLLKTFQPGDIAALFGLIYLYKKAKVLCPADEWEFLRPTILKELELGGHVGLAIPKIGLAIGTYVRTLRHIAMATFLRHDKKHFQEYRRSRKGVSLLNTDLEFQAWGCTDLQVASIFLQTFGLGVEYANKFARALAQDDLLQETVPSTSPFKAADTWIRALSDTQKIPQIRHDVKFYPSEQVVAQLEQNADFLKENFSRYAWIEKGKDDISAASTPQLMAEDPAEKIDPEAKEIDEEIS